MVDVAPTMRAGGNQTGGDRRPGTDVDTADSLIVAGAVTRKWAKGGGPAGDECYNLVAADPISASEGKTYTHEGKNNLRTHNVIPVVAFDTTQITNKDNYSNPQPGDPCHPLASGAHPPAVAFSCKDSGADSGDVAPTLRSMNEIDGNANAGGQVAVAFQPRIGRNGRSQPEQVVPALNGADAGETSDMRPCVATFKPSHFTRDKDGAPSDVCSPLTKETDKGDQDPVLLAGSAVRRLTPRECERLQGLRDDYTAVLYRGKPAADGPRYKALGNSMAVNCMRWIGQRIAMVEEI